MSDEQATVPLHKRNRVIGEPTNADRAAHAAQALEAFVAADGRAQLSGASAMAALITGLVHYADRHGIDFGPVLAASNNSYVAQRGNEEHPYRVGQEVQIRAATVLGPSLKSMPTRGVVAGLYPGGIGPQMYAVRFPGEVNAMPFTGSEIEPAPPFQPVRTRQGIVHSLVDGEDLLVSAAVRIKLDELRKAKPDRADIKDRDLLATVLGELCELTSEEMIRQVQIPVTARVEEGLARQAANALGREHAHARITPFAVDTERRLIAALRERGLTIPPDPAFERIMLVEYHSAFDHASEPAQRNDAGIGASRVPAPQLAKRDFPQHLGESHAIVPRSADPAASSSLTHSAGPSVRRARRQQHD